MQEQEAVLVRHLDEWVLAADDGEPERVWQNEQVALAELAAEGWQMTKGPALVEQDVPGLAERRLWVYVLRRRVQ